MKMAAVTEHSERRGAHIHASGLYVVDEDGWRQRRHSQTIPKYITPSPYEVRYDETRLFSFFFVAVFTTLLYRTRETFDECTRMCVGVRVPAIRNRLTKMSAR